MSREIKFRGKRLDNGQWSTGDLVQLLGKQGQGRKFIIDNRFGACIDNNGDFVNTEAPFVNEVDPETVGEYTGLTDRNGKEIYEGDIVGAESNGVNRYEHRVICYDTWQAKYKSVPLTAYHQNAGNGGWTGYELRYEQLEVIGNILQHPELLEG